MIYNSNLFTEITRTYKQLGGVLDTPSLKIGKYDVDLTYFVIELDEENHFNRYRYASLDPAIYNNNHRLDLEQYKQFCEKYENKCCKHGGYWSNPSSDSQFGVSGENGDLERSGSSRWKQRAFYDFVKDATSIITDIPILRISIYERYNDQTVESLIKNRNKNDLLRLIDRKRAKIFI